MARQKSEETEERILKAASAIFSQKGFSAATTSEIAREANVAEGTIFKYYPTKKDLLHGIVLKAVDIFGESIVFHSLKQVIKENKDKPFEELFRAIAMDRVKLFQNYFPYARVIFNEIQYHQDVREIFYDKIAKKAIHLGTKLFEEGKAKGEFRDINSLIAIRSFMGMLFLMFMQREFLPSENAMEDVKAEIDMLIDIFMNGVKSK
jgi:AcrR family transcriptional regulator